MGIIELWAWHGMGHCTLVITRDAAVGMHLR